MIVAVEEKTERFFSNALASILGVEHDVGRARRTTYCATGYSTAISTHPNAKSTYALARRMAPTAKNRAG